MKIDSADKLGLVIGVVVFGICFGFGVIALTSEKETVVYQVPYYDCSSANEKKITEWVETCYMSNWNTMNWCKDHASKLFCKKRVRSQTVIRGNFKW